MADEVTIEDDGPLLLIGVNRPDAHNLWNLEVIQGVCRACKRFGRCRTPARRCQRLSRAPHTRVRGAL